MPDPPPPPQVLLWERKLQMEREMRAALEAGPDSTGTVAQAEADLQKAEARHVELLRVQERMIAQMEAAISRRDSITTKVRQWGGAGTSYSTFKQLSKQQ